MTLRFLPADTMWPTASLVAMLPCHATLNPLSIFVEYLVTIRRKLGVFHILSTAVYAQLQKERSKGEIKWPVFSFPFCYYNKTL